MTDEQRQALAEKDRGTKHYKAKEFDQAIEVRRFYKSKNVKKN